MSGLPSEMRGSVGGRGVGRGGARATKPMSKPRPVIAPSWAALDEAERCAKEPASPTPTVDYPAASADGSSKPPAASLAPSGDAAAAIPAKPLGQRTIARVSMDFKDGGLHKLYDLDTRAPLRLLFDQFLQDYVEDPDAPPGYEFVAPPTGAKLQPWDTWEAWEASGTLPRRSGEEAVDIRCYKKSPPPEEKLVPVPKIAGDPGVPLPLLLCGAPATPQMGAWETPPRFPEPTSLPALGKCGCRNHCRNPRHRWRVPCEEPRCKGLQRCLGCRCQVAGCDLAPNDDVPQTIRVSVARRILGMPHKFPTAPI